MAFLWFPTVSRRGLAAEATTQQLQSTLWGWMVHIASAGSALDGRSRAADDSNHSESPGELQIWSILEGYTMNYDDIHH